MLLDGNNYFSHTNFNVNPDTPRRYKKLTGKRFEWKFYPSQKDPDDFVAYAFEKGDDNSYIDFPLFGQSSLHQKRILRSDLTDELINFSINSWDKLKTYDHPCQFLFREKKLKLRNDLISGSIGEDITNKSTYGDFYHKNAIKCILNTPRKILAGDNPGTFKLAPSFINGKDYNYKILLTNDGKIEIEKRSIPSGKLINDFIVDFNEASSVGSIEKMISDVDIDLKLRIKSDSKLSKNPNHPCYRYSLENLNSDLMSCHNGLEKDFNINFTTTGLEANDYFISLDGTNESDDFLGFQVQNTVLHGPNPDPADKSSLPFTTLDAGICHFARNKKPKSVSVVNNFCQALDSVLLNPSLYHKGEYSISKNQESPFDRSQVYLEYEKAINSFLPLSSDFDNKLADEKWLKKQVKLMVSIFLTKEKKKEFNDEQNQASTSGRKVDYQKWAFRLLNKFYRNDSLKGFSRIKDSCFSVIKRACVNGSNIFGHPNQLEINVTRDYKLHSNFKKQASNTVRAVQKMDGILGEQNPDLIPAYNVITRLMNNEKVPNIKACHNFCEFISNNNPNLQNTFSSEKNFSQQFGKIDNIGKWRGLSQVIRAFSTANQRGIASMCEDGFVKPQAPNINEHVHGF